jgi:flavin-dependent dehydrogenase
MFDVVVVGARCGGAPLAMLLARAGHRVALVDRTTFPSDTMSTHFLWQRGAARLQRWGLLDQLQACGCAPTEEITFDVGAVQLVGLGPAVDGVQATFCPRRTVLDTLLVEAAVEAGAELIDGFVVDDVQWNSGRVAGVRGHRRGTPSKTLPARVVVGADGLHSRIAERVDARPYREHPTLTGVYYSYWSGLADLGAAFHSRPGRLILTWPTNNDQTCIYVAWPTTEVSSVKRDVDAHFHAALGLVPGLREAVASGRREQRFTGTDHLPNLYRVSAGPGWALVGDAGHHKDPSTGMGMTDAFAAAELLFDSLHAGLTGEHSLDDALSEYQRRRDAVTANGYELTLRTARLAPLSPRLESFYRDAADRTDVIEQIFGVLGGSVPTDDVFSHVGQRTGDPSSS